jgi:hypothetical protein
MMVAIHKFILNTGEIPPDSFLIIKIFLSEILGQTFFLTTDLQGQQDYFYPRQSVEA